MWDIKKVVVWPVYFSNNIFKIDDLFQLEQILLLFTNDVGFINSV